MNYNFARTVIKAEDYAEVTEKNGRYIVRIKEDENADGTLVCAETATTEEPQLEVVRSEYNTWVEKQKAAQLGRAITAKIAEITDYDTSDAVNGFTLNGKELWLDKSMRVGLVNSTTIEKEAGKTETVLWFDGVSYTLPVDTALKMLAALELYALECYNVTAAHKAEVAALTSVEEVEAYDITSGYPERLTMEV